MQTIPGISVVVVVVVVFLALTVHMTEVLQPLRDLQRSCIFPESLRQSLGPEFRASD